jgi:hypothetical protein
MPVVLFAYARPDLLERTLECLRKNGVPLIYAYSDGPRTPTVKNEVHSVRDILRAIDWCDVRLVERPSNLGLGISIRQGVTEVLQRHTGAIVFEDDLICARGTYQYLVSAMRHYENNPRVMSVTGWTHPRITPCHPRGSPYFDGRAECLVWGTWSRAWQEMRGDATSMMRAAQARGRDIYRYGADLPEMAAHERRRNIWAVSFLYSHILHGGLCLRPPYSLVDHIGFDSRATNSPDGRQWSIGQLPQSAPVIDRWPSPVEHPDCPLLWQQEFGGRPNKARQLWHKARKLWRQLRGRLHWT